MKYEFKVIADLIEKDKRVLDVGCSDGTLMKFLKDNKNINIRGLEISKDQVQKCIAKGLTVIEGNAEKDLKQFPDKAFDYVILSQTLQAFLNPELVINELLRVGKKAIVTISFSSTVLEEALSYSIPVGTFGYYSSYKHLEKLELGGPVFNLSKDDLESQLRSIESLIKDNNCFESQDLNKLLWDNEEVSNFVDFLS